MLPIQTKLASGALDGSLKRLYGAAYESQKNKYAALAVAFEDVFGAKEDASLFSAPGRSEIGGNHTDHQLGRVLAAAAIGAFFVMLIATLASGPLAMWALMLGWRIRSKRSCRSCSRRDSA